MKATIKDIARLAGVAPSTVSRALAGSGRIGESTRNQILEIAKQLDYHPNAVARALVSKRANNLGLVLPGSTEKTFEHPLYPEVLRGMGGFAALEQNNFLMISTLGPEQELEAVMRVVDSGMVQGLVLMGTRVNDATAEKLMEEGFPFVSIGRPQEEVNTTWVDNDNVRAAYELTFRLLEKGHRRIAFLGEDQGHMVMVDRFRGYRDALLDAGIGVDNDLVIRSSFIGKTANAAGLRRLLTMADRPTAILASDDSLALWAMPVARACGLKVPEDISFAGFHNLVLGQYVTPALTTVETHPYLQGQLAIEFLTERIRTEGKAPFRNMFVPYEIIERDSVAERKN